MKNRHLDSLVLCAIYAVGRLRRLKTITFKHIIQKYVACVLPTVIAVLRSHVSARGYS